MIAEAFLMCALALPVSNFADLDGGHDSPQTKEEFLRQYNYLKDFLTHNHPDDDFLIIPNQYQETPPGWERLPFEWNGHLIYRKRMQQSA